MPVPAIIAAIVAAVGEIIVAVVELIKAILSLLGKMPGPDQMIAMRLVRGRL